MQAPTDPYETSDANFFLEEVTATSSSANHALQTLLQLPVEDLLCHIDLPPDREPVVFDVDPSKYPMQPWTRAVMTLKTAKTPEQAAQAKKQLSQWFNFGLTPETFVEYAAQQRETMACIEEFAPLMELCEHQGGAVQEAALERAFAGSRIQEHARSKVQRESGTPMAALLLCGWDATNQQLVHNALVHVVRERMGPDVEAVVTRLVNFIRASAMSIGFAQVLDVVDANKDRATSLWELFDENAHRDGAKFISLVLRLPQTQLATDAFALICKWA